MTTIRKGRGIAFFPQPHPMPTFVPSRDLRHEVGKLSTLQSGRKRKGGGFLWAVCRRSLPRSQPSLSLVIYLTL